MSISDSYSPPGELEKSLHGAKGDDSMSYHRAKELINDYISKYSDNFDDVELPEVKITKEGNETKVEYKLSGDTDMYEVVKTFSNKVGGLNARSSSRSSLFLTYENASLYIGDSSLSGYSIRLTKEKDLNSQEIDAIVETYIMGNQVEEKDSPKQRLEEMGVSVFDSDDALGWDYIAGYEGVKQEIKDTVILPLKNPEIYENIARGTRKKFESVRPKAVLFEGPPGTGKTTSARIIANQAESSMLYVPVESIMTKWYGESERNLSEIFSTAQELGDSIIFLDEIDSLATSREKDLHEASRRVLSVLLRKIDGFEPNDKTIMVGATNRKNDLDPALLSRFDLSVNFPLPNLEERVAIYENYAKQLNHDDLERLARSSDGVSGRNIKDICEHSERRWASKKLRGKVEADLPNLDEYLESLNARKDNEI